MPPQRTHNPSADLPIAVTLVVSDLGQPACYTPTLPIFMKIIIDRLRQFR